MLVLKTISWAMIFSTKLRFPPGTSITTILTVGKSSLEMQLLLYKRSAAKGVVYQIETAKKYSVSPLIYFF